MGEEPLEVGGRPSVGALCPNAATDAVELKEVHVVVADHLEAPFGEGLAVFRLRQREAAGVGGQTNGLGVCHAGDFGLIVAAPRAQPCANVASMRFGVVGKGANPLGKPLW